MLNSLCPPKRSVDLTRRFSQNSVSTAITTAYKSASSTKPSGLRLTLAAALAILHISLAKNTSDRSYSIYYEQLMSTARLGSSAFQKTNGPGRHRVDLHSSATCRRPGSSVFASFHQNSMACPARSWFSSLYGSHMVKPVRLVLG